MGRLLMKKYTPKTINFSFDLLEWLEAQAEKEHRHFSGQVVYLLNQKKLESEKGD